MTTKKTRFSTNRNRAASDREAIDEVVDRLTLVGPDDLTDENLEDLSDLSRPAATRLAERWSEISYPVRLAVVREMVNRFENDIEHHYDRALVAALHDVEVDVKLIAFEGLTETNEALLLNWILKSLVREPASTVRAAGAQSAGQFVLEAELGRLSQSDRDKLRDVVFQVLNNDDDSEVRLQMLESAAFFSGDQAVIAAIQDAWTSGSHDEQVSALRAMGRQCDARWLDLVLQQFQSDEPELRFEAARSSATVGNQTIVPQLIDLTNDEDVEVQMAAIASLGSLGGETALAALRSLEQSESSAIAEAAGEALEEALLVSNVSRPPQSLW